MQISKSGEVEYKSLFEMYVINFLNVCKILSCRPFCRTGFPPNTLWEMPLE